MLEPLTLTRLEFGRMGRGMSEPPKIRKKTGYHHGDLRAQLIEATRHLVETRGPDHFSVAEAARVAGVSSAAPYRHFADRDEMLRAVVVAGMTRHYAQMVDCLEGVPPASPERIMALGRVYVGFALAEPGVFRLIFGRHTAIRPDDPLPEMGVRPLDLVEAEVAAARGCRTVDADIRERAFLLWTFVHGVSFLLIDEKVGSLEERGFTLEQLLRTMADRMLR